MSFASKALLEPTIPRPTYYLTHQCNNPTSPTNTTLCPSTSTKSTAYPSIATTTTSSSSNRWWGFLCMACIFGLGLAATTIAMSSRSSPMSKMVSLVTQSATFGNLAVGNGRVRSARSSSMPSSSMPSSSMPSSSMPSSSKPSASMKYKMIATPSMPSTSMQTLSKAGSSKSTDGVPARHPMASPTFQPILQWMGWTPLACIGTLCAILMMYMQKRQFPDEVGHAKNTVHGDVEHGNLIHVEGGQEIHGAQFGRLAMMAMDGEGQHDGFVSWRGKSFYLTTPIYYVNDKPHLGHAYTSVACDVIARFMRLDGADVKFASGTDEHGQKVEESAKTKGYPTTLDFCNEMSQNFSDLLVALDCSNDIFVRTTSSDHQSAACALWDHLQANGYIYLDTYAGWYSVRDETFYNEADLVDGKAPTGAEVEWIAKEPSYFFKLSAFQEPLLNLYNTNPGFAMPASRLNEVRAFVEGGLKDLSISRTSFQWGISVPGDDEHVMYVWVDALANYLSVIGYPDSDEMKRRWPADLHVIGKDILKFHAVYWPALLMAVGLEPPKKVFAHGWWTRDGQKMSKSIGNVINPNDILHEYGSDALRFFMLAAMPFGSDGDFSLPVFLQKVNSSLSNDVGNLAQRTLTQCYKNCETAAPVFKAPLEAEDEALLEVARTALKECQVLVGGRQALHLYVDRVLGISRAANAYIETQAPWALRKTDEERMKVVLWTVGEALRHIAILLRPVVPKGAEILLDNLGIPDTERDFFALEDETISWAMGTKIPKPTIAFPRFELPAEEISP